jgi:Glycine/D-amino acid oxidases (deaminating)
MTIWIDDGFHLRVRDGRVLLLWPDPAPSGFGTEVEEGWLAQIGRFVGERLPVLRDVPLDRAQCWAGLYEMSPDRHALLGKAPGWSNLYLINGSSGHGVMHAPALGEALAEMILDGRARSVDVAVLRPERFAEGAAIRSSELL